MAGKTVPISRVPEALLVRLDGLVNEIERNVSENAKRALDRSTICRLAIQDLVDLYEDQPMKLAERLGLRVEKEVP